MGQILTSFLSGNQLMPSEIKNIQTALPLRPMNESCNGSNADVYWCCVLHRQCQTKSDLVLSSPGCDLVSKNWSVFPVFVLWL